MEDFGEFRFEAAGYSQTVELNFMTNSMDFGIVVSHSDAKEIAEMILKELDASGYDYGGDKE